MSFLYARGPDICIFFRFYFMLTDLSFNKSIGNARLVCLWVGWLMILNVPVNNFLGHVGTEPPLPGYYQYFLGSKCALLKDTTRFDPSGARTPDLLIRSPRH